MALSKEKHKLWIDNIALHLKNFLNTKDVIENSVAEDFSVTVSDGKNYITKLWTAMNQAPEDIFESG
jgi:hypothetical protein